MKEVVVTGVARTPFGLYMGSLAGQRPQDLAAASIKEAIIRASIDSSKVDVCIFSEAKQSSFPANVGRHGWLLAGLDEDVAGFTQNALCAGALQTMISGFSKIAAGEYGVVLAGGVETNSQAPYYIYHPRYQFGPDNLSFRDAKLDVEINAQPVDVFGKLTAATLADMIAMNYGISRELLDEYACSSLAKAVMAGKAGRMDDGMVAITKKVKKATVEVTGDDGPRTASIEKLMSLPAINSGGTATQGNVAPLADGSASILMMSSDRAEELGCKPLAKIVGFGIAAGNPKLLERTTIRSIQKALKFSGVSLEALDFIDIHEPSAAYAVVLANKLGDQVAEKINVDGGSIAYGHAGAATGGAMMVNMIYRLQRTGAGVGLVNVGALGGQSLSIVVQRV